MLNLTSFLCRESPWQSFNSLKLKVQACKLATRACPRLTSPVRKTAMDKMLLPTAFMQQLHRHVHKIQQVKPTGKLMNMAMAFLMLSTGLVLVNGATPGRQLSYSYYDGMCPNSSYFATSMFQNLTDAIVKPRVIADQGNAPGLMRISFHDCIVGGCEASVLLNSTADNVAERDAIPNLSLRGFEVIDEVKAALEDVCPGVFSCADIIQEVALAAQRYVNQPNPRSKWALKYGRRDGRNSSATEAVEGLPSPFMNLTQLQANFANKGLNKFDLVTLSGSHTFGRAHCFAFLPRLYNFSGSASGVDPALDPNFAEDLKKKCPQDKPLNIVDLDVTTPTIFDNKYYDNIYDGKVLFTSDDTLKGDPLNVNANRFSNDLFVKVNFALSFTKMTEINVILFPQGEIRSNCALRK